MSEEILKRVPLSDLNLDLEELEFQIKLGLKQAISYYAYRIVKSTDTLLAGRLLTYSFLQNLQKIYQTTEYPDFGTYIEMLKGQWHPTLYQFLKTNAKFLKELIVPDRDYLFDYFAQKTLIDKYLTKTKYQGMLTIIETSQFMYMRIATSLHYPNLQRIAECYHGLSQLLISHASPTMFNAGWGQLSSCFMMTVDDDLVDILDCNKYSGLISKHNGGNGICFSKLRHSEIKEIGNNEGILKCLQVFDRTTDYVNQAGRRPGACTIYLEAWHPDIQQVISSIRENTPPDMSIKRMEIAIFVNDLFLERVKEEDGMWMLICPKVAEINGRKLVDTWGKEFEEIYLKLERIPNLPHRKWVKARELWHMILDVQMTRGFPFLVYCDSINYKSNQQHLGKIMCANLCLEICEYSTKGRIPSCNLATLCLRKYVKYADGGRIFDFELLGKMTGLLVRNLNEVIDRNVYFLEDIKRGNSDRPIGIGVMGLAEVFLEMNLVWESPEARELDECIFACIYQNALLESARIAQESGSGSYQGFEDSLFAKGVIQPDLWASERSQRKHIITTPELIAPEKFGGIPWQQLRETIQKGMRNCLLVALPPTASTSQIAMCTESFESMTSNLYSRGTNAGDFIVQNRYLIKELEELGVWNPDTREALIANLGSIQFLKNRVSDHFLKKYKTAYEISQRWLINMMSTRSKYICQSASFNLFVRDASIEKLDKIHLYAWSMGIKSEYYIRTASATTAIPINLSNPLEQRYEKDKSIPLSPNDNPICRLRREAGEHCSGCA